MTRAKRYLDVDVVAAARQRIEHIYDTFDSVAVMFSGGKDSQVCLHLVKEFHDKWNLGPVNAVFRDKEIINPSVVEFVNKYRQMDWVNLYWYCLPSPSQRLSLGKKVQYIDWDPDRKWVRPMPEWAITKDDIPNHYKIDNPNMDDLVAENFPGKVAFITGVRASESLMRFRAVSQKLNDNYISKIEGNPKSRVRLCKPIYDWQLMDIFKYLYDNTIPWCDVYDAQELSGVSLRVATPMHPGAAKRFHSLKEVEPEYYQAIVDVFPDMAVQDKYGNDVDPKKVIEPYLKEGFNGVVRYIKENIEGKPGQREALKRASEWKRRWKNDPENYPLEDLLNTIAFGFTERRLAGRYLNSKREKEKAARGKASKDGP